MSWDDAVLYNDYEGMKECYAKLQEENNRFQKLVNVSKKLYPEFGKNAEYFLKLEAVLDIATNYTCWKDAEEMSKALLTVLGDSAQNTDYVQPDNTEERIIK